MEIHLWGSGKRPGQERLYVNFNNLLEDSTLNISENIKTNFFLKKKKKKGGRIKTLRDYLHLTILRSSQRVWKRHGEGGVSSAKSQFQRAVIYIIIFVVVIKGESSSS